MDKKFATVQIIKQQRLLPLFYHDDVLTCIAVTKALYNAGIRCIEFTNRGGNALKNFTAMMEVRDTTMPELPLGIGTISMEAEALLFIDAEADFLVSPFFDSGIFDIACKHKILWMPGCTTPTEIHTAKKRGCTFIKLFPGNILGPGFAEATLPLFTGIDCMLSGGVDASEKNLNAWFNAGVAAVGMCSKLITKDILRNGDYDLLIQQTKEMLAIISR